MPKCRALNRPYVVNDQKMDRIGYICDPSREKGPYWNSWIKNQSVENAGVAFVKGANERNVFFFLNKQTVVYDEQVRTIKGKRLTIPEIWG